MAHRKLTFRSRRNRQGKTVRYPILGNPVLSPEERIEAAKELTGKPKSLQDLQLEAALELFDNPKATDSELQEAAEYVLASTLATDEEKNIADAVLTNLAEKAGEKESLEIAKE